MRIFTERKHEKDGTCTINCQDYIFSPSAIREWALHSSVTIEKHRDSTTGLLSTSITPSFPFIVQMLYIFCFAFESQVDVFVFVCFFHVVSSLI